MRAETEIIKHLATKLPPDKRDYRPTPEQRSTLELMQYMTRMAIVPAIHAIRGGWEHAEAFQKETASVTPENFSAEMDRQMSMLGEALSGIDEAEATTAPCTTPWGTPTTVAAGLLDMALKCLVAYRMQFFLYLKASGLSELSSYQCWAGMDAPES